MSLLLKRPHFPGSRDKSALFAVAPTHFAPPPELPPHPPSLQHRPEEPPAPFCDELPRWLEEQLQEDPLLDAPGKRTAQSEYWIGRVEDFIEEDNEVGLRLRRLLSEQYDEHWEKAPEGGPQTAPCDRAALVIWSELLPDGTFQTRKRLFIDPVVVSLEDIERWRLLLEETPEALDPAEPPPPELPSDPEAPPEAADSPITPQPAPMNIRRCDRITPNQLPEDQLTLITYGPGSGEAMIVKLPDGRFGVVDGCGREDERIPPRDGRNPVWDFFKAVSGLCEEGSLAFVALTHPHDDHWGGLGGLLKHFARRIDRLIFVADHTGRVGHKLQDILSGQLEPPERKALMDIIRAFYAPEHEDAFRFFGIDLRVGDGHADGTPYSVVACGPLTADVRHAYGHLLLRDRSNPKQSLFKYTDHPNLLSGALLLSWGTSHVLLGGDLLVADPTTHYRGWGGVMAGARLPSPIHVIKVAHHASEGAHEPALWAHMKSSLAIVTPFKTASMRQDPEDPERKLPYQPPKPDDIARLLKTGAKVVITTPPKWLGFDPTWPERCWAAQPPNSPPPADHNPIYNAVAVSMDAHGNITQILLGGEADFYQLPPAPTATPPPPPSPAPPST